MNLEKQKLCLSYMMSNNDLATRINSILDPIYFDPQIRHAAHFAKTYLDKYRNIPTPEQILAETGVDVKIKELSKHEVEFATTELEQFCKESAIEKAILASPKLLEQGDYGKIEKLIKDAITIGLNKNLGLDYFQDPEERLKRMLLNNVMVPTKWLDLDTALNGGLMRKEMTLFSANSGVGKSLLMMNLSINLIEQGLNVAYISLELSEDVVAKRFDSMVTGICQTDIFKNIQKVSGIVQNCKDKYGKLYIKRMPESTTNANHIRAYLKEFESLHGFIPDALVVDYMDIMTSNNKISAENLFVKDKYIAEELRSIANEYNLILITASQQNRGAINSSSNDLSQGAIAGGISKVNTTDNLISIIQSDQMKAAGEYMLKLLKTRSSGGVGSVIALGWNPISLRVTNLNEKQTQKIFRDRKDDLLKADEDIGVVEVVEKKKNILDMMRV
jgi:archaellum biogenesis ATPase FlaH